MPKVNGKKFPYTAKGMMAAKMEEKKMGGKMSMGKKKPAAKYRKMK